MNFKSWYLFENFNDIDKLKHKQVTQDKKLINKNTIYFDPSWKEIFLKNPPKNSSLITQNELKKIRQNLLQNDKKLLKKIKEQDVPNLENFFINLLKDENENINKELKDKISKISEELSTISLYYKKKFNRPRPYEIQKLIDEFPIPIGRTTGSPSYPSTHALIGTFMSLWLSKLFPKHKAKIQKLGKELGQNRVYAGFHFQSDCDAGNYLAQKLLNYFL